MSIRILAIETSVDAGSVAAAEGDELIAEAPLDRTVRSAQSLAPTLKQLLDSLGWDPKSIDLVAVDIGPGSFTGTRIGVTTAKTFAYAVEAECLGVQSLQIIAAGAPKEAAEISVAIDAQRRQVFAANFIRNPETAPQAQGEIQILDNDVWINHLHPGVTVTGPALEKLQEQIPSVVSIASPPSWTPRASALALLAAQHHAAGRRDDLWKLKPLYMRKSAAEEVWLKRHG